MDKLQPGKNSLHPSLDAPIEIAKEALMVISMGTEDPHPPYRSIPASRLSCIAAEALEKIKISESQVCI